VSHANGFATGFDITAALTAVCEDIASRIPELSHIGMEHVALSFSQARRGTAHGMLAKLTPLRFEGGALTSFRNGQLVTVQRLLLRRVEQKYILSVYLPRFFDLPFHEKLNTVVHELYHISPRFDGDIRRFPGRCFAHSDSHRTYDQIVQMLLDGYLRKRSPRSQLLKFLHHDFSTLRRTHGEIVGSRIPIPKLIPVRESRVA
jgi:hypothetical protein